MIKGLETHVQCQSSFPYSGPARSQIYQKNNRAVKSTSAFADGNKIKGTLRSIKDISERQGRERMCQTNTFSHSLRTIS